MATKWKLKESRALTEYEVSMMLTGFNSCGYTQVKAEWDGESVYFIGNSNGNEIPSNAIELLPIHWQWKCELSFSNKEWEIRLLTEGLKAQGYTQVEWNPDENAFQGIAYEGMELPPSAVILS